MKKVSERVRGGPFESSKNFNETQFFYGFSLATARPPECCRGPRLDRKCPRKVNHPASQRELRIPLLRRHRSLIPENWLIRQAVPRTLRRDFSVPAFHTTDESVGRRTRPVGNALTVRAGRISRTIRSSFFKSDSSAFWRRLEDQGSGHHTPLEKITCPVRFTVFKACVPQMLK